MNIFANFIIFLIKNNYLVQELLIYLVRQSFNCKSHVGHMTHIKFTGITKSRYIHVGTGTTHWVEQQ